MTTFDDRDKSFENKYALDKELLFKINARRNKLAGLWAAEKLGKSGDDAEAYAKEVILADFERDGDDDVLQKLLGDLTAAGLSITAKDVRAEMDRLLEVSRQQIMGQEGG